MLSVLKTARQYLKRESQNGLYDWVSNLRASQFPGRTMTRIWRTCGPCPINWWQVQIAFSLAYFCGPSIPFRSNCN
jgi:hypothetical protein